LRRYLTNTANEYVTFGTLTYGADYPLDGREVKDHLKAFREACRRRGYLDATDGPSICWWLEFQARGAPHVHFLAETFIPKTWLSSTWARIVGNPELAKTATRVEQVYGGAKTLARYAAKYASKQYQKEVPENFVSVGRFWGVWGLHSCPVVSAAIPGCVPQDLLKRLLATEPGGFCVVHDAGWIWFSHEDEAMGDVWHSLRGFAKQSAGLIERDRDGSRLRTFYESQTAYWPRAKPVEIVYALRSQPS
jgi:hypothetical protein